MASRRRWCLLALMVAIGSAAPAMGAGLPPGATVEAMKAAHGKDAVELRDSVLSLKYCPPATDPIKRDEYAKEVISKFEPLLGDENADARLNVAIMIASLQTISCDSALTNMVTKDTENKDPAVRYWGAKGLADIAPQMKSLSGATARITKALQTAGKVEAVVVVQNAILKAQAAYEDTAGAIDTLDKIAAQMQAEIPDTETLESVSYALGKMAAGASALNAADKKKLAQSASFTASFAVQQQLAYKAGGTPPSTYYMDVYNLVDNALKCINAASGKNFDVLSSAKAAPQSPEDLALNLSSNVTGSPGGSAGKLHDLMQTAVPPVIKTQ